MPEKCFTAGAVQSSWTAWCESKVRKRQGNKRGRARAGIVDRQRKEEEVQTLWGMLYADDTGIVSRSPEGLEKMMTVIVPVCRVRADGLGGQDGDHVPANVRWGARAVHRCWSRPGIQTVEFVYLGGAISADSDLRSVEVTSNPEGMGVLPAV